MILVSIHRSELVRRRACDDGLRDFDALATLQGQIKDTWSFEWTRLLQVQLAISPYRFHAQWLIEQSLIPEYNLSGANLRGANLTGANLRGANLRGADLTG